jgi:hypothetical protein
MLAMMTQSPSPSQPGTETLNLPLHVQTPEEACEQEACKLVEGQQVVAQELKCYEDDGVALLSEHMSDLSRYWEVSSD